MSLFFYGLLLGLVVMGAIIWLVMPKMMIKKRQSKLSFSDTIAYLESEFTKNRWQVPKVYDIQKSLQDAGHKEAGKIKIISMCHPDYAYEILSEDSRKFVSGMMPCRIGVYESTENDVFIAQMNVSIMSKMFGGVIKRVMATVATEEEKIINKILK